MINNISQQCNLIQSCNIPQHKNPEQKHITRTLTHREPIRAEEFNIIMRHNSLIDKYEEQIKIISNMEKEYDETLAVAHKLSSELKQQESENNMLLAKIDILIKMYDEMIDNFDKTQSIHNKIKKLRI